MIWLFALLFLMVGKYDGAFMCCLLGVLQEMA